MNPAASVAVRPRIALALTIAGAALGALPAHAGPPEATASASVARLPQDAPRHLRWSWWSALQAPLPATAAELSVARTSTLPAQSLYPNADGLLGHVQADGPVDTRRHAFFQSLGTNGRSCASCHLPADAMSISTDTLRRSFRATQGRSPVFAPVDAANCPSAVPAAQTRTAPMGGRRGGAHDRSLEAAYSLLLQRGLFRVFLPLPATTPDLSAYGGEAAHPTEFTLSVVSDPYGCNTDPAYAQVVDPVTQQPVQMVSVYRRPRMAANLAAMTTPALSVLGGGPLPNIDFVTGAAVVDRSTGLPIGGNLMWDGREPTLESQARDATLGHAQATTPPTDAQIAEIVAFERNAYSAQRWMPWAGDLAANGAGGGPLAMQGVAPSFAGGFSLYDAWAGTADTARPRAVADRASIARGQALFNGRSFTVQGVAGFNDAALLGVGNPATTTCASCHGNLPAGSDPLPAGQRSVGIGGQSVALNGPAPSKELPIFKLSCRAPYRTPFDGSEVLTNDPGLALITGRCADIGRRSVPQIRALSARAPYFSDGSATTVRQIVDFYNRRFSIGLGEQEARDLTNFLSAL